MYNYIIFFYIAAILKISVKITWILYNRCACIGLVTARTPRISAGISVHHFDYGISGVCVHYKCDISLRLRTFLWYLRFTVRLHVMQRTVLLSQFCLSVRLSVRPSVRCVYCEKTKQRTANILIARETPISLVF